MGCSDIAYALDQRIETLQCCPLHLQQRNASPSSGPPRSTRLAADPGQLQIPQTLLHIAIYIVLILVAAPPVLQTSSRTFQY